MPINLYFVFNTLLSFVSCLFTLSHWTTIWTSEGKKHIFFFFTCRHRCKLGSPNEMGGSCSCHVGLHNSRSLYRPYCVTLFMITCLSDVKLSGSLSSFNIGHWPFKHTAHTVTHTAVRTQLVVSTQHSSPSYFSPVTHRTLYWKDIPVVAHKAKSLTHNWPVTQSILHAELHTAQHCRHTYTHTAVWQLCSALPHNSKVGRENDSFLDPQLSIPAQIYFLLI